MKDFSEFHRLHPLTLINRVIAYLPALAFLFIGATRSGDAASKINLVISIVGGLFLVPWILTTYFRFSYRIDSKEVTIHKGVFTRQRRNIPMDRIQNVEIEQRFLQQMLGLAKVTISTAGSAQAEGVLESVKLSVASEIKDKIKLYQSELPVPASEASLDQSAAKGQAGEREELFRMKLPRVFLAGLLQFSLIYIAFIFSTLQLFSIGPEQIFDWFDRGELSSVVEEVALPKSILIGIAVLTSILLGWVTGALLTVNRYLNFRLWKSDNKIYKKHGLLTLSEDAIPVSKVHALVIVSNPMMRLFGWLRLEIQTMGVQSGRLGRKVVMPLVRPEELVDIGPRIVPFKLPSVLRPVSKLTVRRSLVRLGVASLVVWLPLIYFQNLSWVWLVSSLLFALAYSLRRYDRMGFNEEGDTVYIRSGVWNNRVWIVDKARIQSIINSASFFQRRLGLQDLIIDTAGASPLNYVRLPDLPELEADECRVKYNADMQDLLDAKVTLGQE